jgi:uncharacterized protein (DUF885 family)
MVRLLSKKFSPQKIALAIAVLTFLTIVISHTIVNSIASAKLVNWIARSNENTHVLIKAEDPSACTNQPTTRTSLLELDSKYRQCHQQQLNQAIQTFQTKLNRESDPSVKLDLEILIQSVNQEIQSDELNQKYRLPYVNLAKAIASSLERNSKQTLLKQLRQYAGLEPGSTAIVDLALQQMRDQLGQPNLFFPEKAQLEKDLAETDVQLQQIRAKFERQKIDDYQEAYTALKNQLSNYTTFVRQEVLPKARTDFRLAPELYAARLSERGVEIPVETVMAQARTAFQAIQQDMESLAPKVAQQQGLQAIHYRDVIRGLKQAQLSRSEVLPHYEQRQKQIETIIRRERLVTLPKRALQIRLTNDRENAEFPVPQYFPPRSSAKTAGVFIIPVLKQSSKKPQPVYDDFTYPAVSWTLTAHEGRPGHDLQFTTIQDKGTSEARSRFGYNSANHEGWALYAEAITLPYMPIDGQFISLQFQLLRTARAFLEPELQLGKISKDEALRVLTEDAGYSQFFAQQEIARYTEKIPGQAPSYFYGYQQLMQLRRDVEQKMGQKFDQQKFHDFILAQGFMPQRMLRKVVMEQFVQG